MVLLIEFRGLIGTTQSSPAVAVKYVKRLRVFRVWHGCEVTSQGPL
jgi:hypothetical protein